MRSTRFGFGLTLVNLVLLVVLVTTAFRSPDRTSRGTPGDASDHVSDNPQAAPAVVRARALEIVDARGQVRSRINVEESGDVVLRLLDRTGTIRVKLGASETGSGLVLMDEATEPAVHLLARRVGTTTLPATTGLTLRAAGGREQRISP